MALRITIGLALLLSAVVCADGAFAWPYQPPVAGSRSFPTFASLLKPSTHTRPPTHNAHLTPRRHQIPIISRSQNPPSQAYRTHKTYILRPKVNVSPPKRHVPLPKRHVPPPKRHVPRYRPNRQTYRRHVPPPRPNVHQFRPHVQSHRLNVHRYRPISPSYRPLRPHIHVPPHEQPFPRYRPYHLSFPKPYHNQHILPKKPTCKGNIPLFSSIY